MRGNPPVHRWASVTWGLWSLTSLLDTSSWETFWPSSDKHTNTWHQSLQDLIVWITQNSSSCTLLPGLGPLFLYGRGASWATGVVWGVTLTDASVSWEAVDAARAFRSAMVSLLGRRPLMPFRTGSWGRGMDRRYGECMARRAGLEFEKEEDGAGRGFGMVTGSTRSWKLIYK